MKEFLTWTVAVGITIGAVLVLQDTARQSGYEAGRLQVYAEASERGFAERVYPSPVASPEWEWAEPLAKPESPKPRIFTLQIPFVAGLPITASGESGATNANRVSIDCMEYPPQTLLLREISWIHGQEPLIARLVIIEAIQPSSGPPVVFPSEPDVDWEPKR